MTIFYLAARYSRRAELCGYREQLRALGHKVPARWLNGAHQLDDAGRPLTEAGELAFEQGSTDAVTLREKFAADDYLDVVGCDALIAFTETPRSSNSRGGRHVELGIALGRPETRVVVVGPRENIFCWLPFVEQYDTWAEFFLRLAARTQHEDCAFGERHEPHEFHIGGDRLRPVVRCEGSDW